MPCWIAAAHDNARLGPVNISMMPSPVVFTSMPPVAPAALRSTAKCAWRRVSAASRPMRDASAVEPTRSVKRKVGVIGVLNCGNAFAWCACAVPPRSSCCARTVERTPLRGISTPLRAAETRTTRAAIPEPRAGTPGTSCRSARRRSALPPDGGRSDGGLLQDVDAAGRAETDDVGHADLGALDLPVARLTAQLGGDLEHAGCAGHADRVTLGEQPARRVDRRGAVTPGCPPVDEVAGPAGLAQPQVVVVDELGGGEAVVELHQVEVLGAHARQLVRLVGRVAGERVDVGLGLAALDKRVAREHRCAHLHRTLLLLERECLELRLRHQDDRGGAVAGRAAHRERVRVRDHARVHDLLEREDLVVLREGVERGVLVVLLRDLGELLEAHAVVLVRVLHAGMAEHRGHGARAEPTVDRHDAAVATLGLVLVGPAARRVPGEEPHLAHLLGADGEAEVGHARRDLKVRGAHRGGTGRARVHDVVDRDAGLADLLGDLLADAAHVEHAPGRQDLHVEDGDAGVVERVERGLRGQVDHVLVGIAADLGHRGAEHPDGFTHWKFPSPLRAQTGSNPNTTASVPSSSVPATNVVRRTFIPSFTCSGSDSTLTTLAFTSPPPSRSTTDETYGTGTPGAAWCTMANDRTTPVVPSVLLVNSRLAQRAQALRRSKNSAPHLVHSLASRCGSPSSSTR